MENNPENALQEAIARRSQGGQAPAPQDQQMPPQAPQLAPQGMPAPDPAMGGGLSPQVPEAQIIIKALSQRLAALSKLSEMTMGEKGV